MGEIKSVVKEVAAACQEAIQSAVEKSAEAMRLQTPGGVFSVRWHEQNHRRR
ncbi:MAG: hypothetical protein ABIR56_19715 [Polaromonas sp.]